MSRALAMSHPNGLAGVRIQAPRKCRSWGSSAGPDAPPRHASMPADFAISAAMLSSVASRVAWLAEIGVFGHELHDGDAAVPRAIATSWTRACRLMRGLQGR